MADDGRARILGSVRRALAATGEEPNRLAAVEARLGAHRRNLIPERGQGDGSHRMSLFRKMAEAASATTEQVASEVDLPQAISRYLRDRNLPQRVRHGADPLLADLPWRDVPALEIAHGRADPADEVSVSHAFAGVAETGTLVLASGPDNPTTLNFLPENHIVVLKAGDVAGAYEEVWDRLREVYGEGVMPRTVNMITGPSRTGDIEQKIELGAHGPRRLHVILVGEPA